MATQQIQRPTIQRATPAQLYLTIRDGLYAVRKIDCDPLIGDQAYRLLKADGNCYDVIQTRYGPSCDCPDFLFRRDGLDPAGCKHIQALVACGLIEPQSN